MPSGTLVNQKRYDIIYLPLGAMNDPGIQFAVIKREIYWRTCKYAPYK
jgi:hypothetical protein